MRETTENVEVNVQLAAGVLRFVIQRIAALECSECGSVEYPGDALARVELSVAREIFNKGLREGRSVRFARKALGMRASDLADVLDVTPETVSRWENDRIPVDLSVWAAIGSLVNDRLCGNEATLARLRAAKSPQRIPAGIQVLNACNSSPDAEQVQARVTAIVQTAIEVAFDPETRNLSHATLEGTLREALRERDVEAEGMLT